MSPPSAWMAGRMTSITCSTFSVSMFWLSATSLLESIRCAAKDACSQRRCVGGNNRRRRNLPRVLTGLLLAHQGGWDEMLFVLVPVGAFAGLLALANRRR